MVSKNSASNNCLGTVRLWYQVFWRCVYKQSAVPCQNPLTWIGCESFTRKVSNRQLKQLVLFSTCARHGAKCIIPGYLKSEGLLGPRVFSPMRKKKSEKSNNFFWETLELVSGGWGFEPRQFDSAAWPLNHYTLLSQSSPGQTVGSQCSFCLKL